MTTMITSVPVTQIRALSVPGITSISNSFLLNYQVCLWKMGDGILTEEELEEDEELWDNVFNDLDQEQKEQKQLLKKTVDNFKKINKHVLKEAI